MTPFAEQLLRGRHFYTGLRVASGLLGLSLLVYAFSDMQTAVTASMGGLCTSIADIASPRRHKPAELLAGWAASSCLYLLIGCARPMPVVLGLILMAVSFCIAMSAMFGPKAGPVGFAGTFGLVFAFGLPPQSLPQLLPAASHFALGGFLFVLYSTLSARFLAFRTKEQMLAESSFDLAKYLRIKASFYEKDAPLEELYPVLLRQQTALAVKQQDTREFLFRDTKQDKDLRLAEIFIMQIDFFEYILASNTDYELLQKHYSGSDAMLFLRDLVRKTADTIDAVGYAALRHAASPRHPSYKAEIYAIEREIERLRWDRGQDAAALTALVEAYDKIVACTEITDEIQKVQNDPDYRHDTALSLKLSLFTTTPAYNLRLLRENCNFGSPYFRYALRAGIAMELGYLFTLALNHWQPDAMSHSYWVLLNISVVLRSSFSMTAERRTQRIVGSTCGCLAAAAVLQFSPTMPALLLCLFAAQVVSKTFVTVDYRFTSAAASLLALLQIHMLAPATGFALGERLVDTVIGCLIAYGCSFIFPSWEYRSLPRLMAALAAANTRYMRAVLDRKVMDEEYRLARRGLFSSVAGLSEAFDRMLREPKPMRRAIRETARFTTLSYLFAARMASIRMLLARLAEFPALQDRIRPEIDAAADRAAKLFGAPEKASDGPAKPPPLPPANENDVDYAQAHMLESLRQQLEAALLLAEEAQTLRRALETEQAGGKNPA